MRIFQIGICVKKGGHLPAYSILEYGTLGGRYLIALGVSLVESARIGAPPRMRCSVAGNLLVLGRTHASAHRPRAHISSVGNREPPTSRPNRRRSAGSLAEMGAQRAARRQTA